MTVIDLCLLLGGAVILAGIVSGWIEAGRGRRTVKRKVVEQRGIEPLTSAVRLLRSPI